MSFKLVKALEGVKRVSCYLAVEFLHNGDQEFHHYSMSLVHLIEY